MKTLVLLIAVILTATSCKTKKEATQTDSKPIITFQKTSCYGKCPVYSLEIFANGKIKFKGEKNIDKIGNYNKTISKKEIEKLKESFISAGFFDLKDEYTSKKTDLPTTFIAFENKGQYKKIKDYSDAPEVLNNLEKMIEDIVNAEGWEKQGE